MKRIHGDDRINLGLTYGGKNTHVCVDSTPFVNYNRKFMFFLMELQAIIGIFLYLYLFMHFISEIVL